MAVILTSSDVDADIECNGDMIGRFIPMNIVVKKRSIGGCRTGGWMFFGGERLARARATANGNARAHDDAEIRFARTHDGAGLVTGTTIALNGGFYQ
ncbi:MAG: hypothetical protein ACYDA5_00770 [Vulcanimicrobiaceae bacterium]